MTQGPRPRNRFRIRATSHLIVQRARARLGNGISGAGKIEIATRITPRLHDAEFGFITVVEECVPPGIDLAEAVPAADRLPVVGSFLQTRLRGVGAVGGCGDGPAGLGDPDGEVLDALGYGGVDSGEVCSALSLDDVFPVGVVVHADEVDVFEDFLASVDV